MHFDESRRRLLKNVAVGTLLIPIAATPLTAGAAGAANLPLVTPDDPTAKALKYTPDAKTSTEAKPGSHCATCALYQGSPGAPQGPCQLFPGKDVKSTGWCASWTAKAAK